MKAIGNLALVTAGAGYADRHRLATLVASRGGECFAAFATKKVRYALLTEMRLRDPVSRSTRKKLRAGVALTVKCWKDLHRYHGARVGYDTVDTETSVTDGCSGSNRSSQNSRTGGRGRGRLGDEHDRDELWSGVKKLLTPDERRVVRGVFWDGFSHERCMRITGLGRVMFRRILANALAKIREKADRFW